MNKEELIQQDIKYAAGELAHALNKAGGCFEVYCKRIEVTQIQDGRPRYVYEIIVTENKRVT